MTDINRRHLLAGSTAFAAASLAAPVVPRAAAPPAGKQAAGWYRYKLGSFEITVVTDGMNKFRFTDDHVMNKKRDEVSAAQAAAYHERDIMANPYNPVVVNTGSKLVVIDTGTSEANFERSKGAAGQFQANLAAAGIDRNAIDAVIISHYHGDHINGLLKPDNSLAFPNAEILVPAAEHKFFMDDGEMSRATGARMLTVFKNARRVFNAAVLKRVTTYEPGKEIAPGITSVGTERFRCSPAMESIFKETSGKSNCTEPTDR